MRTFSSLTYTEKIKWRIRALWALVFAMLAYMVIVGELGGGDSRIMTDFAEAASSIILFGGLAYVIYRIICNKKLLKNRMLLKEQMQTEQDERNRYLYDKSGGIVINLLLVCLLFITCTTALFDMTAFYTSVAILALTVVLKVGAYLLFSRM